MLALAKRLIILPMTPALMSAIFSMVSLILSLHMQICPLMQRKAGGQTASIQGETEGAKKEEGRKDEDSSNKSNDEKDQEEDNDSKSTSFEELETKELSKPPATTQASTKSSQDNIDEGKEGTADDDNDDDDPLPLDVEVPHRGRKKGGRPRKGTTGEPCVGHLVSQMAKAAGDFGTPQNCRRTGSWSPGCLFSWAWPMTSLMPLWMSRVIIPLMSFVASTTARECDPQARRNEGRNLESQN